MASPQLDAVLQVAGYSNPKAASASRSFDLVIAVIAFFTLTATFHIHFMLLAGDWDFWVDWKDRQYWITLTPPTAIMFCAATQYFLWEKFRAPFGATLCCLGLLFGEWVNRVLGFHMWAGFPYSLIWPSLLIPSALFLDATLLLTRNWLLTGIVGAWGFGLLFYPAHWAMLAPYHLPVNVMGEMASVADLIGYHFVRSATPEYLRFIERGTLRIFGGHSAWVASFFTAFLCTLLYYLWWLIGAMFSKIATVPNRMRTWMGFPGLSPAERLQGMTVEKV